MTLSPRVGDIVRTRDGHHLLRVTRIIRDAFDARCDVACLQRCGDHAETVAALSRLVVVEAHPGGVGT